MAIAPRPPPSGRSTAPSAAARRRSLFYQILAVAVVALLVWWLASTTLQNMRARGIQGGFGFLLSPAGFEIGESWLPYQSTDAYWQAFLAGLGNTLKVAAAGILICTLLGTLLGIGRFSVNAIVRALCYGYVELFRNIPLLLQLLAWYLVLTQFLPAIDDPATIAGWVSVSKNGVTFGPGADATTFSPEFITVLLGLSLYTSAFVAEIVRAGIAAVPRGQIEAASALGLPRRRTMRLVVLPQALRVIVPPLTGQYLNLLKNSSLGVAVGYPDLVSIANTSLNQTGRAVECITLVMAVYLAVSLVIALLMNRVNRGAAITGG
ncbi:MAG: amino acid transporter permease [Ramlibacter sp.]|nr:amino acid transporter permease [Ramlibacter sp.]